MTWSAFRTSKKWGESNKYGDTRLVRTKLSREFDPTTEASNTILGNKFAECKIYDVIRNPKEWITELELLRIDL